MGSYGIGVGRLMAGAAEEHHDDDGLMWPVSIAPYHVYLVRINDTGDPTPGQRAEELYEALTGAGIEVLYDDRDERPGVKFKDADLIGLPVRLTVSKRSLEAGGVEYKLRSSKDKRIVPIDLVAGEIKKALGELQDALDATVVPVPYDE